MKRYEYPYSPYYAGPGLGHGYPPAGAMQPPVGAPQPPVGYGHPHAGYYGHPHAGYYGHPHAGYYGHPHAGYHGHPHYGQPAAPGANSFFNVQNPALVKGALVGAAAAYLLTNENVQQGIIRSIVKVWSTIRSGAEELKERFQDAQAELHAQEE